MVRLSVRLLVILLALLCGPAGDAGAEQTATIRVRVIGGFARTRQFDQIEVPFWTQRVPSLTGGQMLATIQPFAQAGVEPGQMLSVMRSGVVMFGTLEANAVALAEPELAAADLPLLSSDLGELRRFIRVWEPRVREILSEQYGAELLATLVRPPQLLFCRQAFTGLRDLKGRRIRVASVNQSDLLLALGAQPVVLEFRRVQAVLQDGTVDCAVTGGLPGHAIGLHRIATHLSTLPLGWAMSFLTAHQRSWQALPAAMRDSLQEGFAALQADIWQAAEEDRDQGEACNFGEPRCRVADRGRLVPVREDPASLAAIRALFSSAVLPGWAQRCGLSCAENWNAVVGPSLGTFARW
ncbi:TRAP-type C4-dicarboxylate transport system, substrate-binding protein [Belnapia rosea]|nr:TRAP-type C4-dicarboxylate transport system, substrate-binding protein [Belnapia rosea]